jgi:ankyrin repeat protein
VPKKHAERLLLGGTRDSALSYVARRKSDESKLIKLLIAHGANPNINYNQFPLLHAASTGHVNNLKALRRGGADIGKKIFISSSNLRDALAFASGLSYCGDGGGELKVKALLATKLFSKNSLQIALDEAFCTLRDNSKIIKLLLGAGADPDKVLRYPSKDGRPQSSIENVKAVLASGAINWARKALESVGADIKVAMKNIETNTRISRKVILARLRHLKSVEALLVKKLND